MHNKEGGENIDSLCAPCIACDSENDYFKLNPPQQNFTQKCQDWDKYTKLFLKLKQCEDQCHQLKNQINFDAIYSFTKNLIQLKVFKHK